MYYVLNSFIQSIIIRSIVLRLRCVPGTTRIRSSELINEGGFAQTPVLTKYCLFRSYCVSCVTGFMERPSRGKSPKKNSIKSELLRVRQDRAPNGVVQIVQTAH